MIVTSKVLLKHLGIFKKKSLTFVDSACNHHIGIAWHRIGRITRLTFSKFSFPIPAKSSIPSTFCSTITRSDMSWQTSHSTRGTIAHQTLKARHVWRVNRSTIWPMTRLTKSVHISDPHGCTPTFTRLLRPYLLDFRKRRLVPFTGKHPGQ